MGSHEPELEEVEAELIRRIKGQKQSKVPNRLLKNLKLRHDLPCVLDEKLRQIRRNVFVWFKPVAAAPLAINRPLPEVLELSGAEEHGLL